MKTFYSLLNILCFCIAFALAAMIGATTAQAYTFTDSPPIDSYVTQTGYEGNIAVPNPGDSYFVVQQRRECDEISKRILARPGASWNSESHNTVFDSTCESILRGDPQ